MSKNSAHVHPSDLRGASRLVIDAIVGVTHLVEAMHANIAARPAVLGASVPAPARGIAGFVYRSVRAVTRGVGLGVDAALGGLVALLGAREPSPGREAVVSAINGVLGDHLAESGNPLAIPMHLRRDGRPLQLEREALAGAIEQPSPRLLVLVHGLCMNDLQWSRSGQSPAEGLAAELGYSALYLHYNSGRHVSDNGRLFAAVLERLVEQWPVPVTSLAFVAHSMGGLVLRSACHYAAAAGMGWPARLGSAVFVATPHHGAPLERGGNWIDVILGASPYTAPLSRLGKIRSAGITDLRYGNLLDEDWQGRDRFERGDRRQRVPLPAQLAAYAIAGMVRTNLKLTGRSPGDGLVPVDSALGRHEDPLRDLRFAESNRWVGEGMNHFDLLTRPEVWARIRDWLAA